MLNPFTILEEKLLSIDQRLCALSEIIISKNNYVSPSENEFIGVDEAAKLTGYKKNYLYELKMRGKIPFVQKGRSLRFNKKELELWLMSGRPDILQTGLDTITANRLINNKPV